MIVVTSGEAYTDIDGLACAVAYSELLGLEGKSSCVVLPGVLNHSVSSLVQAQSYVLHESLPEDVSGFALVDISNNNFSSFVQKEQVLEVYDHHYGYKQMWEQYLSPENIHIEMIGACATLIWEAYKLRGFGAQISATSANLLTIAIISNTLNLQSALTTARDRDALVDLAEYNNLPTNWREQYFAEQEQALSVNPVATITNDAKVQQIPALADKLVIGQLELWDGSTFFDTHLSDVSTALSTFGHALWMMNIPSISEGKNYIYTEANIVQHILQQALGCEFEDNICITDTLILRKEILKALHNL